MVVVVGERLPACGEIFLHLLVGVVGPAGSEEGHEDDKYEAGDFKRGGLDVVDELDDSSDEEEEVEGAVEDEGGEHDLWVGVCVWGGVRVGICVGVRVCGCVGVWVVGGKGGAVRESNFKMRELRMKDEG